MPEEQALVRRRKKKRKFAVIKLIARSFNRGEQGIKREFSSFSTARSQSSMNSYSGTWTFEA
jgi:hypothetical protein